MLSWFGHMHRMDVHHGYKDVDGRSKQIAEERKGKQRFSWMDDVKVAFCDG